MKIKLNSNNFLDLLTTVLPAVSNRSTLPSLSHFLINAESNFLKIYATDLEIGIESLLKTNIEKEGKLTIPAKNLTDIIRVIDSEYITLQKINNNKYEISSDDGFTKFNVLCGNVEDYPEFPGVKEDKNLIINTNNLKQGIEKTIFSVSRDESRYILCGLYFENDGKNLRIVSTDGRRLSFYESPILESSNKFKAIIPTKAINILDKLLTDDIETIKISLSASENQIYFSLGNTIIYSRLIEGDYPNYDQVIPENPNKQIKVNTIDILNATKKVMAATIEKSTPVKYIFKNNKSIISLEASDGSGKSTIPVDYNGDEIEMAFNPEFMINTMKAIKSEKLIIELTSPINPGKFMPDSSKEKYVGVIMPMRP
ncbi:DNA polymerase III subunit beta [Elusimicrobiota bacterium]